MSPALVLSSQIKCSAPGDKGKMNKLAALERKMQVTGDYGSDSDSDRRAEREREGRPPARSQGCRSQASEQGVEFGRGAACTPRKHHLL